ncbi:MAG: serine--tRNA ligase, partial [Solirubrobacterales bacterium]|nr:serine--tRNA ligase [Solirubrobacterales bacterium]
MLDLKAIRSDAESIRAALARRHDGSAEALDEVIALDTAWREATAAAEDLRAEQKASSKGRQGAPTEDERRELAELAARGRSASDAEVGARSALDAALAGIPNPPLPDSADEDQVVREVGESGAEGRDHLELAGSMIDVES